MQVTFIADRTLGRLAKWLRILGFDTLYDPEAADSRLHDLCRPGSVMLTRTHRVRLKFRSRNLIFIKSNDPEDQLREVIKALNLSQADVRPFSRCLICNTPIEPIEKESIRNAVPDYVWETQNDFRQCPRCRKIYWHGSHTDRSMERIKSLFEGLDKHKVGGSHTEFS